MNSSVALDSQENVYVVWSKTSSGVWLARSTDGGETFLPSALVDSAHWGLTHPHIAIDADDNLHITWTDEVSGARWARYTKSTDKGQSFLPGFHILPDWRQDQYPRGIAVDTLGNPMIVWRATLYDSVPLQSKVFFVRSYDGGASFEPPVIVDSRPGYYLAPSMAVGRDQNIYISYSGDVCTYYQYVFVVRSTDGGFTFGQRVWVDADTSQNSTSSITVVRGSREPWTRDELVLVVWNERREPEFGQGVYFAKSTDFGATFGNAVTVTDSGGAFPVVSAGGSGDPVVVWVDPKTDRLFYSNSEDGGMTFLPPFPISGDNLAWDRHWFPGLALAKSGIAMVAWSRTRTSHLPLWQVYFAKGRTVTGCEEIPVAQRGDVFLVLDQNSPNPFCGSTIVPFALALQAPTSLRVYDPSGRLVRTLVDEDLCGGRHVAIWDGKDDYQRPLPSGTYFLKLGSGGITATRKTVLLR